MRGSAVQLPPSCTWAASSATWPITLAATQRRHRRWRPTMFMARQRRNWLRHSGAGRRFAWSSAASRRPRPSLGRPRRGRPASRHRHSYLASCRQPCRCFRAHRRLAEASPSSWTRWSQCRHGTARPLQRERCGAACRLSYRGQGDPFRCAAKLRLALQHPCRLLIKGAPRPTSLGRHRRPPSRGRGSGASHAVAF